MLSFTIYISLFIPVYISFNDDISGNNHSIVLKSVSPYVFIIDTLKYLNTGCFVRGQLINERLSIIKNYFKERCFFDVISIVTLFLFDKYPVFSHNFTLIFFYLRLYFGLHFIGKIRESFLLKEKVHAFINILTIVSFIFFFAHIFACFWYYIGYNY